MAGTKKPIPAPPIGDQDEVGKPGPTWEHPDEPGHWFTGIFRDARMIPFEDRETPLFLFTDVDTSEGPILDEDGEVPEQVGVWGTAVLAQRIDDHLADKKVTIVYDGLGGRNGRTKMYRVFADLAG